MIDPESVVFASAAAIGGPVLFVRAFRRMRIRRLMLDTPTARIRSMAMGMVELNGTVEPRSTVLAPFSGHECVYWQVEVAVRQRRGWATIHRNHSGNPFFLRDETGVALVYPQGSECKVRFGVEEETTGFGVPEPYASYMKEHHVGMGLLPLAPMRFRERALERGVKVYVLGRAMPRAQSYAVTAGDEMQATGTDDLHTRRLRDLDREACAIVRRGERDPVLLISQESERELSMVMGWKVFGMMIAGPALTLIGFALWLAMLWPAAR